MRIVTDRLSIWILCLMTLLVILVPAAAKADPGTNYCITPPYVSGGIKPNLLLMIDNSASMYDLGYIAGSTSAVPSFSCGTATVSSSYCFDNTYSDSQEYEGYFSRIDPATNEVVYPVYHYSGGKFVEYAAGIPTTTGTGIYRTDYLHVTMTGSKATSTTTSTRAVSSFYASGKFLNWLSASKFDIQKKILTGGKYNSTSGILEGESRGCVGRRFVKVVPAVPELSFAVRGPTAVEPNYDPSTQGGGTRIEIFEGDYNESACQCAVYNWTNGNYGQAATNTKDCLGTSPSDNALSTLNHTQQTCWLLKENIRKGALTDTDIWRGVNTNDIETACTNVYTSNKNPLLPSEITNESSGNYICTSQASHATPVAPYNINGSDTAGFVGSCWQTSATKFTGNTECVKREMLHYCLGTNFTEVTDPTSVVASSGNIPAVIMDAGVRAIGEPAGVFYAKVGVSSAPTGLIHEFAGSIRFGAMRFNDAGSATECGTSTSIPCPKFCSIATSKMCSSSTDCLTGQGTCVSASNKDAGVIMTNSHIGDSVGNHGSGLINDIGTIPAKTWTPFAEAYYNAISYFVKDAVATTATLGTKFTPATASPLPIATPLDGTDSFTNQNPIQYRCQQNNILFITDGSSTADVNSVMTAKVTDASKVFRDPATLSETGSTAGKCGSFSGSPYLHDLSYFAYHRNIFDPSKTCRPAGSYKCETAQTIKTHVVYSAPVTTVNTDVCDPYTQMRLTATNGGTTVKTPANPVALRNDLRETLQSIASGASSGTAASILSNSEGSGANILQAVFYPTKIFDSSTSANWVGEMQNLWYFVDPYIQNSTIREDSGVDLLKLNLTDDNVIRFAFDTGSDKTMVQRYSDADGDGVVTDADKLGAPVDPDAIQSIWRAGKQLWARDISTSARPRVIYTPLLSEGTEVAGTGLMRFSTGNVGNASTTAASSNLKSYLQYPAAPAQAVDLIRYVHGFDFPGDGRFRSRTVKIGNVPAAAVSSVATDPYVANPRDKGIGVWKLGDIISSTPRVQSTVRLNTFNLPAPGGYSDKSYDSFVNSKQYKDRGMVYVGANDGMLHAFTLGVLSVSATGHQKASLAENLDGDDLGEEKWAFIPKNSLPYLKYLADKDYNHIYSVDGRTIILDASIGNVTGCSAEQYWLCPKPNSAVVTSGNDLDPSLNTWRTIVIGGMGLGGASRNNVDGEDCVEGAAGTCVKTPISGVGLSSYFALDVTDPATPKLLWEFSNNELGFATSAPAIVRIGPKNKNGRWFAVFGSGPMGPIDTGSHQFKAQSDQHLKFFVVDLRSGERLRTITLDGTNGVVPHIDDAFVGTLLGGSIDADRRDPLVAGNYQDDAIYAGFVKKVSGGEWTDGGVIRIMTKEDPNPDNWVTSLVIDGIGPVTTSVARMQDTRATTKKMWLYFGTGRYFYRDAASLDDNGTRRALFGIQEPCYNTVNRPGNVLDGACTATVDAGSLLNQTGTTVASIATALGVSDKGWRIDLDEDTTTEGAERVVTDSVALTNGAVFFTSFKPTLDICGYGGNSYLWGVKYDTGGNVPANALKGKALIQLSTGEFREVDLATAFTDQALRRMSSPMTGKPPSDAPPIVSNSSNRPVKKILHIREH